MKAKTAFEREMIPQMERLFPKPTDEQMREFLDSCLPSDRFLQIGQKARIWMSKYGLKAMDGL
jgi:hypothetical protein